MKFKKRKIYKVKDENPNKEYKYIDTNKDGVVGDFTVGGQFEMYMPSLNLCTRGNGTTNRVGDTIRAIKLDVRMALEMPNKTGTTANGQCGDWMRIIIYVDKQVNANAPVATDIMSLNTNLLSHYNAFNEGRFKILYDEVVEMHQSGASQGGTPVSVWGHRYKPIKPICIDLEELKIDYKSNFGTLADLTQNNIGIMVGEAFTGNMSIDIFCRLWFTD